MKKNVASQSIGVQMITAADGTAFTGAVSVLVTIDNGTQTAGGGTAPAHEGNGYHSYTPTQAETNGDHVAFTFTGSGAIPATVQVYTQFPQTGDNFARLGAPAGASVSADIAAVKSDSGAILTDTAEIGAAGAGLTAINLPDQTMNITGNITGNLSGSVGSVTGNVGGIAGTITTLDALDTAQDTQHATTQGKVDTAQADLDILTGTDGVTLATSQPNYAPATAAALATVDSNVDAILLDTAEIGAAGAGLTNVPWNASWDAEVQSEVEDALTVARAEPTGVPAANESLVGKVDRLYMMARNQKTVTATKKTYFDDAGTAEFEADVSDDGTTYTETELNAI